LLKRLIERDEIDRAFIADHTSGWEQLVAELGTQSIDELCARAGVTAAQLDAFADEYVRARSAILLWSMGITQHHDAVDGVQAIVNVALARGNVGRNGAGLMPIRGHSGVQGGAEMGAYATSFPGPLDVNEANAAAIGEAWGFAVPSHSGLTAPEMVEAAERDELDVLWMSGGNFLDVLPDPPRVEAALERVPLRVHQDIVLTSQMLVPGDDVILLPVCTRYEQEGGGTETTTERRVVFSPEIPRHVGEARSEWRLFADVARRVRPDLDAAFRWPDNRTLRQEIAEVVPRYAGIETLARTGDQVQWGGRHLCPDGAFPTETGRAQFSALTPTDAELADDQFTVATRRGKQFNSMVFAETDPLTGATRDAVYIDETDARAAGLVEGDQVRLESSTGAFEGRVKFARLPHRSLQVHWPEGNVLLAGGADHREPGSQVPDYNAVVTLTRV
jgi:molybdopterin-dependent oxidoreductase alpha subunit